MEVLSSLLASCEGNPSVVGRSPSQRATSTDFLNVSLLLAELSYLNSCRNLDALTLGDVTVMNFTCKRLFIECGAVKTRSIFIQILTKEHPIARREGEVWSVCFWYYLWFIFCPSHCRTVCKSCYFGPRHAGTRLYFEVPHHFQYKQHQIFDE